MEFWTVAIFAIISISLTGFFLFRMHLLCESDRLLKRKNGLKIPKNLAKKTWET